MSSTRLKQLVGMHRVWALALIAGLAATALAADTGASQQTTLILRILAFDRKLPKRASGSVTVAVVFSPGSGKSESMANDMISALEDTTRKASVGGLPVKAVKIAVTPRFDADLQQSGAKAAYLCSGLEDSLGSITRATQAQGALTFSNNDEYLKSGASIALVNRDTRLGIVVHLGNVKAEGAEIDSNLLRLAEIIR
jgi:hypothetical protein